MTAIDHFKRFLTGNRFIPISRRSDTTSSSINIIPNTANVSFPQEIINEIAKYTDYETTMALSATDRANRDEFMTPTFWRMKISVDFPDLLEHSDIYVAEDICSYSTSYRLFSQYTFGLWKHVAVTPNGYAFDYLVCVDIDSLIKALHRDDQALIRIAVMTHFFGWYDIFIHREIYHLNYVVALRWLVEELIDIAVDSEAFKSLELLLNFTGMAEQNNLYDIEIRNIKHSREHIIKSIVTHRSAVAAIKYIYQHIKIIFAINEPSKKFSDTHLNACIIMDTLRAFNYQEGINKIASEYPAFIVKYNESLTQ